MGEKSRGNWQIPFCLESCQCRACLERRRRARKRAVRTRHEEEQEVSNA